MPLLLVCIYVPTNNNLNFIKKKKYFYTKEYTKKSGRSKINNKKTRTRSVTNFMNV